MAYAIDIEWLVRRSSVTLTIRQSLTPIPTPPSTTTISTSSALTPATIDQWLLLLTTTPSTAPATPASSALTPTTIAPSATISAMALPTSATLATLWVVLLLLFDLIYDFFRHSKILNLPNVSQANNQNTRQPTLLPRTYTSASLKNLSTFRASLYYFLEGKIHPCVAIDKMPIERFTVLELDKHGMALGGRK